MSIGRPLTVGRPGNPDPREHVGLAWLGANKAAARLRLSFGQRAPTADELLGAAYLGVEMSSRTFDPGRGFKFSTLAVRNAYFVAMREGDRQIGYRGWKKGLWAVVATDLRGRSEDDADFFDRWVGERVA